MPIEMPIKHVRGISRLQLFLFGLLSASVLSSPILLLLILPSRFTEGAKIQALSTISQVIASVFAITLAAVYLALQLISSYSSRLLASNRRLVAISILYLCLFIPAMTLPIVAMKSPDNVSFTVILTIGTVTLMVFPVYLVFLLLQLTPAGLVKGLQNEIVAIIKEDENPETYVQALYNYMHYSFKSGDYDTMGLGIDTFLNTISIAMPRANDMIVLHSTFNKKWFIVSGDDVLKSQSNLSFESMIAIECLTRIAQVCVFAGNDTSVNMEVFSKIKYWIGSDLFANPAPALIDCVLLDFSVILMILAERKMNDAVWFSLNIVQEVGRQLFRLYPGEKTVWRSVIVDYICILHAFAAACRAYLPGFLPLVRSMISDAHRLTVSHSITTEARTQSSCFLKEVFPDIPIRR